MASYAPTGYNQHVEIAVVTFYTAKIPERLVISPWCLYTRTNLRLGGDLKLHFVLLISNLGGEMVAFTVLNAMTRLVWPSLLGDQNLFHALRLNKLGLRF